MKAKKPHHFIKLNAKTKADMHMWLYFLESLNGKTYFPESSGTDSDVLELFTDSAGSAAMGCGAYFSGQRIHFSWPETLIESYILKNIAFLEFVAVVLALAVWGNRFQNKKIKFNIDNLALVEILNSQTSKSKRVMNLMGPFVLYTMQNNIIFHVQHVLGKVNCISDSISRQQ